MQKLSKNITTLWLKNFKILLFLFFIILPITTSASTLTLDSKNLEIEPEMSFAVDIFLDDVEECVNTVELFISFPNNEINFVDFFEGESILNMWVDKPGKDKAAEINKNSLVHLSGGVPGGYCGKIPGDPGPSNVVGRMIFKSNDLDISENNKMFKLEMVEGSRVLLNDGLGTADAVKFYDLTLQKVDSLLYAKEDWEAQIRNDKIPPLPFVIKLRQDKDIYNNKYYLIFHTNDKQSGIDYYEVLEIRPNEEPGGESKKSLYDIFNKQERPAPEWKKATIPYLLTDQSLDSIVKVRAVDKAGNKRMVEYIPPAPIREMIKNTFYKNIFVLLFIIIILVFVLWSSYAIIRRLRKKLKQ